MLPSCEAQSLLNGTQGKLDHRVRQLELLETRWAEGRAEWAANESQVKGEMEARKPDLRAAMIKAQRTSSYNDGQNALAKAAFKDQTGSAVQVVLCFNVFYLKVKFLLGKPLYRFDLFELDTLR